MQFQVDSKNRAVNIIAIRKKQRAHVDAIKGMLDRNYSSNFEQYILYIFMFLIFIIWF